MGHLKAFIDKLSKVAIDWIAANPQYALWALVLAILIYLLFLYRKAIKLKHYYLGEKKSYLQGRVEISQNTHGVLLKNNTRYPMTDIRVFVKLYVDYSQNNL